MTKTARPGGVLYFEDHIRGSLVEFGPIIAHEKEMIEFAERYDPQIFHTDPDAAGKTPFRGLVASGWYTGALAMRLLVDHWLSHVANIGSPGIDEVRWLKPVRPADRLSVRLTVTETRRSISKPDRGVVTTFVEVLNQNAETVMSWKGLNVVSCRNKGRP
jgi:acyl dehydratase